jgi:hypothetical protein
MIQGSHRIESSNTYRNGGKSYSYKHYPGSSTLYSCALSDYYPPMIWLNLANGLNTVTLYGAHKNFGDDPPLGEHLYFEIDYVDSLGKSQLARSGDFEEDTNSIWHGDTGLTKFKIPLQVDCGGSRVVSVRLYISGPNVTNAYTFIDPEFVIT